MESEACGYNRFDKYDRIQYRAMRFFLRVHKCTPIHGLHGDMGWVSISIDRWVDMMRFWKRLMHMSNDKLTKRVFLWDYQLCHNNWSSRMRIALATTQYNITFNLKRECEICIVRKALIYQFITEWYQQMLQKPKLRTYATFKKCICTRIIRHENSL